MSVPNFDSIVDLAEIGTRELVDLIIEFRGEQRSAWLRTRLNQRLEKRNGRRGLGGARDKVLTNGAAKAAISIHT